MKKPPSTANSLRRYRSVLQNHISQPGQKWRATTLRTSTTAPGAPTVLWGAGQQHSIDPNPELSAVFPSFARTTLSAATRTTKSMHSSSSGNFIQPVLYTEFFSVQLQIARAEMMRLQSVASAPSSRNAVCTSWCTRQIKNRQSKSWLTMLSDGQANPAPSSLMSLYQSTAR